MTDAPTNIAAAASAPDVARATKPSVTCVIVAYNHARFVQTCLESAFAQTHENLRIIVCDDASRDDSQQVIRNYLARTGHGDVPFLAHTENRGLCATLNEAIDLIDTEFVAIISADDWMTPERVEVQVDEMLELGDEYGMLCNNLYIVEESGEPTGETYFERYECDDLTCGELSRIEMMIRQVTRWFLPAPGFFYRTNAIHAIGGFDESLLGEDLDMTLRILHRYRIGYSAIPVVFRRELTTSLSHTKQANIVKNELERIAILRKHFGLDPSLDAVLHEQIGARAKLVYGAGHRYPALRQDLAAAFRQRRSTTTGIYLLAAAVRMPGQLLAQPIGWARRLKAFRGHA